MIFEKGNKITTNNRNCFVILDVNDDSICCKDLLTNDFSIFSKTEHKFELFDSKKVLKNCLKEVVEETKIDNVDKHHILSIMIKYFDLWL
jgi:hypothetical protein